QGVLTAAGFLPFIVCHASLVSSMFISRSSLRVFYDLTRDVFPDFGVLICARRHKGKKLQKNV
ncbi:MAG: hypothetical protein ACR2QH_18175, partial [Geminicoccaceae bacterium]